MENRTLFIATHRRDPIDEPEFISWQLEQLKSSAYNSGESFGYYQDKTPVKALDAIQCLLSDTGSHGSEHQLRMACLYAAGALAEISLSLEHRVA